MKAFYLFLAFAFSLSTDANCQNEYRYNFNDEGRFLCYVGSFNNAEYPITIKEFKFDGDIEPLENGVRYPLLSRLKDVINKEDGWILVSGTDTTKFVKINLTGLDDGSAKFEVEGKEFNGSMNSATGSILDLSPTKLIFMDENKKKWEILKE